MSSEEQKMPVIKAQILDRMQYDLSYRFMYKLEEVGCWHEGVVAFDKELSEKAMKKKAEKAMCEMILKKYRELTGKQREEVKLTYMKVVKA